MVACCRLFDLYFPLVPSWAGHFRKIDMWYWKNKICDIEIDMWYVVCDMWYWEDWQVCEQKNSKWYYWEWMMATVIWKKTTAVIKKLYLWPGSSSWFDLWPGSSEWKRKWFDMIFVSWFFIFIKPISIFVVPLLV